MCDKLLTLEAERKIGEFKKSVGLKGTEEELLLLLVLLAKKEELGLMEIG